MDVAARDGRAVVVGDDDDVDAIQLMLPMDEMSKLSTEKHSALAAET